MFWERTGETGDPKSIDAQAEVVISLCRSLAEEKIPFTIGWNDTDRNLCILYEIRDMDTLIGVMPRLLRATGVREGVSGAALLMQTGSQALCAHMAYIAREPGEELMAEAIRPRYRPALRRYSGGGFPGIPPRDVPDTVGTNRTVRRQMS